MGILTETAKFLEEEKNITREDIVKFREFLAEDVRAQIAGVWANIKRLASEKRAWMAKKAEAMKAKNTEGIKQAEAAINKINASLAGLFNQLKGLRTSAKGSAEMLAQKAKSLPPAAKAAAAVGAAGAGAYALYKRHKAKEAK